jgi:hypothetical protein
MKVHLYFVIALVLLLTVRCENDFEQSSRIEKLDDFTVIELNDVFDVYLADGSENSVEVIGDSEILSEIEVKNDSGKVIVTNNSKMKWSTPGDNRVRLKFNIGSSHSKSFVVFLNETSSIHTVDTLHIEYLQIINNPSPKLAEMDLTLDCGMFFYWNNYQCGGKITVKGKATSIDIRSFAMMTVDATSLLVRDAHIENSSKGNCYINVSDKLEYSIYGTGNIYLKGNPGEIILKETTSSGRLIMME